jgi:hypothetical protein
VGQATEFLNEIISSVIIESNKKLFRVYYSAYRMGNEIKEMNYVTFLCQPYFLKKTNNVRLIN